jgi:hypothetical protein
MMCGKSASVSIPSYLQHHHHVKQVAFRLQKKNRTKVLDEHSLARSDGCLVLESGLAILEGLLGVRVEDANAVVVADASLLGDQDLEVLDCRIGWEFDRCWELPDGLLRSCKESARVSRVWASFRHARFGERP